MTRVNKDIHPPTPFFGSLCFSRLTNLVRKETPFSTCWVNCPWEGGEGVVLDVDLGSTIGELQEAPVALVVVGGDDVLFFLFKLMPRFDSNNSCSYMPSMMYSILFVHVPLSFFFFWGVGEQRSGGSFLYQIALVIGFLTSKVGVGVRRCFFFWERERILDGFGGSWWHHEPILVSSVLFSYPEILTIQHYRSFH